jgi:3-oxoacyl-[acyl-carrier-protein] synthase II
VMNCAAGQSAIWHRLKGPNTTVAGGRATGLLALQYALRLQRAGRAATVLCGAVEEFSSARAWLEWHSRAEDEVRAEPAAGSRAPGSGAEPDPCTPDSRFPGSGAAPDSRSAAVLGEGAAVWLLEPDTSARANGRTGLAEVVGLDFGFAADADVARPMLADVIRRLLDRTGVAPETLGVVADSGATDAHGRAERAALADVFGGGPHRQGGVRVSAVDAIGDTHAASAAFQIAAVLALAEHGETPPGSSALITSIDRDGVVGAALLRTR